MAEYNNLNRIDEDYNYNKAYREREITIYKCTNPNYIRAQDKYGRTLWKSTTLDLEPIDSTRDYIEVPEDGVEYSSSPVTFTSNGALVYDLKNEQYVIIKRDGREIYFPKEIGKFTLRDIETIYFGNNLFFAQYGIDKNGEFAVISLDGVLKCLYRTNIKMKEVYRIYPNPTFTSLSIIYYDENYESRLLFLTLDGKMIKDYPDFDPGTSIVFNAKAPDYVLLRAEMTSGKCLANNQTGKIIAGFDYNCIDMTQVGDKLYSIAVNGPNILVFDVLGGKLIQDLTNLGTVGNIRRYQIRSVKISEDAKEIWYKEQYPDNTAKYFYYKLAM